jgi:hypothetical protein
MSYQTATINTTTLDAESHKRHELIRKLSRDFTTAHPTALEMDKLLAEQLALEKAAASKEISRPKTKRIPKPKVATSSAPTTNESLKQKLLNLLDEENEKQARPVSKAEPRTEKCS